MKVNNLAVANLRSYPLSCIAAIVGIIVLRDFPKDTIARYAQSGQLSTSRLLFGAIAD